MPGTVTSNIGSLLNISTSLTSVVGIAASFIVFNLGANYIKTTELTPAFYAYAGDIVAIVLSQLAAAYAAVKTVDAGVKTTDRSFYYQYAHGSGIGNFLGLYELLAILFFLTWTLAICLVGYVEADLLWAKYREMEKNNTAMTLLQGYKFLALGFIIGVGAWISGLALGDSAEELIGWYAKYDPYTEAYARNSNGALTSDRDSSGTSIIYDLSYHTTTLLYTYFSVTAIAIGGYVFGYLWITADGVPDLS
jgi:hypothetical protein